MYVQYLKFLQRASQGDFGASTAVLPGRDALEIFFTRLPATIELSIIAMAIAIVLAIPLGYVAAKRHGSSIDNGAVGPPVTASAVAPSRPRPSPSLGVRMPPWAAPA